MGRGQRSLTPLELTFKVSYPLVHYDPDDEEYHEISTGAGLPWEDGQALINARRTTCGKARRIGCTQVSSLRAQTDITHGGRPGTDTGTRSR